MSEERLPALAMMKIHWEKIELLSLDSAVCDFTRIHPRRINVLCVYVYQCTSATKSVGETLLEGKIEHTKPVYKLYSTHASQKSLTIGFKGEATNYHDRD